MYTFLIFITASSLVAFFANYFYLTYRITDLEIKVRILEEGNKAIVDQHPENEV
jgi:hypothetical protein